MNSDFKELLEIFNVNKVRYLIIGGYAVMEYAEPRYTKDLDLWIDRDLANAKRLYRSLVEFGAPLANLTYEDFIQEGHFYRIGVPPVMVDILFSINEISFEEAWTRRHTVEYQGVTLLFVAKSDLIHIKTLSNRLQDKLDVQMLLLSVRQPEEFTPPTSSDGT